MLPINLPILRVELVERLFSFLLFAFSGGFIVEFVFRMTPSAFPLCMHMYRLEIYIYIYNTFRYFFTASNELAI